MRTVPMIRANVHRTIGAQISKQAPRDNADNVKKYQPSPDPIAIIEKRLKVTRESAGNIGMSARV